MSEEPSEEWQTEDEEYSDSKAAWSHRFNCERAIENDADHQVSNVEDSTERIRDDCWRVKPTNRYLQHHG
jgi:hypothetical protein